MTEKDLPYSFARSHGVLIETQGETPYLLHKPPLNPAAAAEAMRVLGRVCRLKASAEAEFEQALQAHYDRGAGAADSAVSRLVDLGQDEDLQALAADLEHPADLLEADDDAPVIRLINALLSQAIKENASDIHIEPYESSLHVRFRVDGVLREVLSPPLSIAPLLISRVKVMAHLDIAEKRLPQDGRISVRIGERPVDVRVSTLPSGRSERVVMRLLDKQAGRLDLEQLGMPQATREAVDQILQRPHGIFLVTGPTGSGKTTSLYAMLARLNDRSRNILTVEDPIEYFIEGVGQTQINTKIDMSFARGLRAILRQDPDVVMVGEVRDLETAQIAVQASLTGHLVFSTLHTNTAAGAVTRLQDMGIEPFLLASSLIGVMAQRLVRTLCPHCKQAAQISPLEASHYGLPEGARLYHPKGCEHCAGSGYRGRTGLCELLSVNASVRASILEAGSEQALAAMVAERQASLGDDGKRRVLDGTTSLEEVLRVCEL